jgi:pimeloyl-ACP methyl ester carboxylesterase
MKMKKTSKLLALLLVLALTVSLLPAALAAGKNIADMKDVAAGSYYYDSVAYMLTNRYMNGTGADTFSPDAALTRGMVVTVLYNMSGKPATTYKDTFSDVPDGKYYSKAVVWAAANGIAKGSKGAFAPETAVTREQLASFLYNYASFLKLGTSAKADLATYKDAAAVSSYAKDALAWCVKAKIVNGVGSSALQPQGGATRAQFAAMAYRFVTWQSEPETLDVTVASTTRKDVKIPAYVTLPNRFDSTKSYPMVILCHGHGGNHNEWGGFDKITDGLAKQGIIAVTLDYPGCGASTEKFTENTLTNMKADTLDVVNYVVSHYSIDKSRVGIFGYSMGGRITLELLAEKSYSFAAVEFVAPAASTTDLKNLFGGNASWDKMKATAEKDGYASFTTIYGQNQQLSKAWFADLEKYTNSLAADAAKNYTGRSLVIYATNDEAVSPKVSADVAAAFGSAVVNTYADGHSYSFYGKTPYTVNTVNESSVNFFKDELVTKLTGLSGYVAAIEKDGSLKLTLTAAQLTAAGLKTGDTAKLTVDGTAYTALISDKVGAKGQNVLLVSGDTLTLTLSEGDFATAGKLAEKITQKDGTVQWHYLDAANIPAVVTIEK